MSEKINRETAEIVLNEIMNTIAEVDMDLMVKMTLFAKIQNIIYSHTNTGNDDE